MDFETPVTGCGCGYSGGTLLSNGIAHASHSKEVAYCAKHDRMLTRPGGNNAKYRQVKDHLQVSTDVL